MDKKYNNLENDSESPKINYDSLNKNKKSKNFWGNYLITIITIITLIGLLYNFFNDMNIVNINKEYSKQLVTTSDNLLETQEMFTTFEQKLSEQIIKTEELQNSFNKRQNELSKEINNLKNLPKRIEITEDFIASFKGLSRGQKDTWLLAEAEYFMQLANSQLQLVSNIPLAIIALKNADSRLASLSDLRLTIVRAALANEIQSLESISQPDISGIILTLGSLTSRIDNLPLKEQNKRLNNFEKKHKNIFQKTWESIWSVLRNIIEIQDNDDKLIIVKPDQKYILKANVALKIQTANLALLRGQHEIFIQNLTSAIDEISKYFAPDDSAVISIIKTLSDIQKIDFKVKIPDISKSLVLLRQQKNSEISDTSFNEPLQ
tara:strand:+ start:137 stop:1267 length:1131 start_codon:yes stop_codon:yes gene_type:complete